MRLAGRQIETFLARPDPAVGAVLLYGPDAGLVRERADRLAADLAGDAADPFRISELTAASLRDDPARLADEAAALTFGGGRRVVRVRDAGDTATGPFRAFLEGPPAPAMVVVEAGDLPPKSSLRKLFEAADRAVALPCYRDEGADLGRLIEDQLRSQGLTVAPEALAYLVGHLGNDRAVTRAELEKLALFMGPGGGRVEIDDAVACIGDNSARSLDDLVFAVADGDLQGLDRTFPICLALPQSTPVRLLRAAAGHFLRIHFVRAKTQAGASREAVVRGLKPPVFYKLVGRFNDQLDRWTEPALAQALNRLTEAERACKRTGAPAEALAHRALMQVAQQARFGRRGAGI